GGSFRQGERLKAAIRLKTAKPIRYVINTHMHPDHVLGNAAFADGAEIVAHARLEKALIARGEFYLERAAETLGAEAMAGTKIVTPSVAVGGKHVLDLGGRRLVLQAHPTAH